MIFPAESTMVRQCSHLASTPTTPFPVIQFFGPSSGSCPVPPDPGKADTVASRQGRRPIGKIKLGPKSGINFVSRQQADVGRPIFGDIIGAEGVLASHYSGDRRNAARISLPLDSPGIAANGKSNQT